MGEAQPSQQQDQRVDDKTRAVISLIHLLKLEKVVYDMLQRKLHKTGFLNGYSNEIRKLDL